MSAKREYLFPLLWLSLTIFGYAKIEITNQSILKTRKPPTLSRFTQFTCITQFIRFTGFTQFIQFTRLTNRRLYGTIKLEYKGGNAA